MSLSLLASIGCGGDKQKTGGINLEEARRLSEQAARDAMRDMKAREAEDKRDVNARNQTAARQESHRDRIGQLTREVDRVLDGVNTQWRDTLKQQDRSLMSAEREAKSGLTYPATSKIHDEYLKQERMFSEARRRIDAERTAFISSLRSSTKKQIDASRIESSQDALEKVIEDARMSAEQYSREKASELAVVSEAGRDALLALGSSLKTKASKPAVASNASPVTPDKPASTPDKPASTPNKPAVASDNPTATPAASEPMVTQAQPNAGGPPIRASSWVNAISENPELNARIVLAVGKVLGPSTDTFPGDSFKGVRLGDAYDTTTVPENARIVCDWPAPAPAANQANGRDAEVTVLVAKDTGKIVGISAYYRESFQEMVGDVVAAFGKTPQKPETFRAFAGEFPITITVVKYTCPKTIVRVISREGPQGSLGVSINVFEKEFVLESLRRYANSVAVSCDWLAEAVEGIADSNRPLGQISSLPDCVADADAQSRVLLWFDAQQREGYRRGHKAKEFGPYVPRTFDVAGAFTTADTAAAIVDTLVSRSLGVPLLSSRSVDPQGLQCTIASTAIADMFWDVASSLAQSRFPPADKNISVIRPHPDSPEGFAASMADRSGNVISSVDPDASPAERMQVFEKRVSGDRHEWMDKNGYRVRVGSNLAISVEKPLQAPRRGL